MEWTKTNGQYSYARLYSYIGYGVEMKIHICSRKEIEGERKWEEIERIYTTNWIRWKTNEIEMNVELSAQSSGMNGGKKGMLMNATMND